MPGLDRHAAFWLLQCVVCAPPADFRGLERAVAALVPSSKDRRGFGYMVEVQTRATRAHGSQSLPVRILVPTAHAMLLIGKAAEFEAFVAGVALIRATLPALEPWLAANPQHVREQHGAWPELHAADKPAGCRL